MADIQYTPLEGYDLDGVNHHTTMLTAPVAIAKGVGVGVAAIMPPREHMLINYYYNPAEPTETHMTSVPMAVRCTLSPINTPSHTLYYTLFHKYPLTP